MWKTGRIKEGRRESARESVAATLQRSALDLCVSLRGSVLFPSSRPSTSVLSRQGYYVGLQQAPAQQHPSRPAAPPLPGPFFSTRPSLLTPRPQRVQSQRPALSSTPAQSVFSFPEPVDNMRHSPSPSAHAPSPLSPGSEGCMGRTGWTMENLGFIILRSSLVSR